MRTSETKHLTLIYSPIKKSSIAIFFALIFACAIWVNVDKNGKSSPGSLWPSTSHSSPVYNISEMNSAPLIEKQSDPSSTPKFLQHNLKAIQFLHQVTPIIYEQCKGTGFSPTALIAIACLESGYGQGYVARITGNILSLNAKPNEVQLPPLSLLYSENNPIIDNSILKNKLIRGHKLIPKNRPPSLKKDYRPQDLAGQMFGLDYLLHQPDEKFIAWKNNIHDFLHGRIRESNNPYYKEADKLSRQWYEKIKDDSPGHIRLWISNDNAKKFISIIGGKKNSFNPNPDWVVKLNSLVDNLDLEKFVASQIKEFS